MSQFLLEIVIGAAGCRVPIVAIIIHGIRTKRPTRKDWIYYAVLFAAGFTAVCIQEITEPSKLEVPLIALCAEPIVWLLGWVYELWGSRNNRKNPKGTRGHRPFF